MKEVKRIAKKGEYIKIIKPYYSFNEVGDILKVCSVTKDIAQVLQKNHPSRRKEEFSITSDNFKWNYSERNYVVLEGYRKEESMIKFTKKDLKAGDILTLRNGWKVKIDEDCETFFDIKTNETGKGTLCHYNENLCDRSFGKKYDIVKVERVTKTEVLYEREEEILDEAEKKYLSQVIRPFRKKITCIELKHYNFEKIFMKIYLKNDDAMNLPNFKKGTMYKGMELDREYTLKELGL